MSAIFSFLVFNTQKMFASKARYLLEYPGMKYTWQLLSESGDLQLAFDNMLAEYDVEADQLRRELAELVGQLADAGLVSICPPNS